MKLPFTIEPILQQLRINKVLPHVIRGGILVDVGCDTTPIFLNQIASKMERCIGIDEAVKSQTIGNIQLVRCILKKRIPLPAKSADTVTMLAVLEHLEYPNEIVKECYRLLSPGGTLLITVPSPKNQPLLNLLSDVGLVRKEMIDQHKNYFSHQALQKIVRSAGYDSIMIEGFELSLNTFVKAIK